MVERTIVVTVQQNVVFSVLAQIPIAAILVASKKSPNMTPNTTQIKIPYWIT